MKMKSSSFRLFLLFGYSIFVSSQPDPGRLVLGGDHLNSPPHQIRRDQEGEFCGDIEDSTYYDALNAYAEKSSYTCTPTICTVDFAPVIGVGDMDVLLTLCNNADGDLYLLSATITCESGYFPTKYIDYPLCQIDCDVDSLKGFLVEGGPAGDDCVFTSIEEIYEYGGESNNSELTLPPTTSPTPSSNATLQPTSSTLPRTSAPSDALSLGICEGVEDPVYSMLEGILYGDKYVSECGRTSTNGITCTAGFNDTLVEEGGFDKLLQACQDAKGGLYAYTASISCQNGFSITMYNNMPFCLTRCDVDFIKAFFVEGGPAGDDCVFASIEKIYEYGGENNNTKPTLPPTTSPTPSPSKKPIYDTLLPTPAPSPAPSPAPTQSPVSISTKPPSPPSSSSSCNDSPLMFMVHDIPRCCKWVARNPAERCNKMWAKGAELDINVKSHCPKSCGSCAEYGCSDTEGAFIVDDHGHRECCWLDSLSDNHRVELCSENRIYTTCQDTCGICAE